MFLRCACWLMVCALPISISAPAFAQAPPAAMPPAPNAATPPPAPPGCAMEQVEQTVLVPTLVTEMRKVCDVAFRPEQRQRTFLVCRPVVETHDVQETCTVLVPEQRTCTQKCLVRKPVMRQVTEECVVPVPYQERCQGVRQVCRYVPVTETCTVSVPETRTRTETYTVCRPVMRQVEVLDKCFNPCAPCCGGELCKRMACVWDMVPEQRTCEVPYTVCVPKQVSVTVNKPQLVDVPFEYVVTRCRPERRTFTVNVCDYVDVEETREVAFTVGVPKQVTQTRRVSCLKGIVQEPHTETYVVQVPYPVEREVPVPVCQMVPQKVKVWVARPCAPPPCCP